MKTSHDTFYFFPKDLFNLFAFVFDKKSWSGKRDKLIWGRINNSNGARNIQFVAILQIKHRKWREEG